MAKGAMRYCHICGKKFVPRRKDIIRCPMCAVVEGYMIETPPWQSERFIRFVEQLQEEAFERRKNRPA